MNSWRANAMVDGGEKMIIVDRAAQGLRADPAEILNWAASQRVFISSVIDGFGDYREAAAAAIRAVGCVPVRFEDFGGVDSDPNDAYLSEVRASNIFIGLLGSRYGSLLPSRYSASHEEFREAENSGLRIAMWATRGDMDGGQLQFFRDLRQFYVVGGFDTPAELESSVHKRLTDLASAELSPWCKLGHVLFRAERVARRSGEIVIDARISDREVLDRLDEYSKRVDNTTHFVSPHGVTKVTKVDISSTVTSAQTFQISLVLQTSELARPMRMAFGNKSWESACDEAIRKALFVDGNPGESGGLDFGPTVRNPLPEVMNLGLTEDVIRPVLTLVIGEELAVSLGAARAEGLKLGSTVDGVRMLEFHWRPQSDSGVVESSRIAAGKITVG